LVSQAHTVVDPQNGEKLVTLEDASRAHSLLVIESRAVALAIERLLKAAETRRFADRKAATDQVEIVLRGRAVYYSQPAAVGLAPMASRGSCPQLEPSQARLRAPPSIGRSMETRTKRAPVAYANA
jgi:hypothetical protein